MAWRKPDNLREWIDILLRHKKKFFFPAAIVTALVASLSHLIPREYAATAEFERVNDAALASMSNSIAVGNLGPIRNAMVQDLRGKAAIEQLIIDEQLMRNLERGTDGELTKSAQLRKEEMIRNISSRVRVYFTIRSDREDRVAVTFTDPDPELAPRVVNRLVENYIRSTRQKLDSMLINAQRFFGREVDRYQLKVIELESQKLKFEMRNRGIDPDDPLSIRNTLVELRASQKEDEKRLRILGEQEKALALWIADQPDEIATTTTKTNPELERLAVRLANARETLDYNKLTLLRTDEHPLVVKITKQIEALEQQIANTTDKVESEVEMRPNEEKSRRQADHAQLKGELQELQSIHDERVSQIEQYQIMERNFFVTRNEYQKIERELEEARSQLNFWHQNLRSTTIALRAEVGQRGIRLSITNRAPPVGKPSKPTVMNVGVIALGLGFGVGAMFIVLAELLDHSFRNVDQAIDDLKLPVLGTVNVIVDPRSEFRKRLLTWFVYPPVVAGLVVVVAVSFFTVYLSLDNPERWADILTSVRSRMPDFMALLQMLR